MGDARHWERVYAEKAADRVSWYAPRLERSLELIAAAGPAGAVIDVGGGASTLVDDLLARGVGEVTVLDLSAKALEVARARVGDRARWLVGDVTTVALPAAAYDVWHDRAVFHFLIEPADRAAYVAQVARALRPGGHVVIATFSLAGPERCSGLPVARYDAGSLAAAFGDAFEPVRSLEETHVTPWGSAQAFVYCLLRRRA